MFRHPPSVRSSSGMIQKSLQSGFAPEDLKEGSTSMKRTVMFLLLGPSLVALAVWMVAAAIAGRIDDSFVGVCAITAFLLTLPVSAITGLMDGYLARGLPTLLRASLTAAFGMTIAIGLVLALFTMMFSTTVPPEVMNGAFCAGFSCCCRWACARCCRMTSTGNGIRLNRSAREEEMCGPRNL